jgi:hypothetical protein
MVLLLYWVSTLLHFTVTLNDDLIIPLFYKWSYVLRTDNFDHLVSEVCYTRALS